MFYTNMNQSFTPICIIEIFEISKIIFEEIIFLCQTILGPNATQISLLITPIPRAIKTRVTHFSIEKPCAKRKSL